MREYIKQFLSQNQHQEIFARWLAKQQIRENIFTENLVNYPLHNWLYLTTVLKTIIDDFYDTKFHQSQLPPALVSYYQQHLPKMFPNSPTELELNILKQLFNSDFSLSVKTIAKNLVRWG